MSTPLEMMVRFHFRESTCCYRYDEDDDDVANLNIQCNGDKFLEKCIKIGNSTPENITILLYFRMLAAYGK